MLNPYTVIFTGRTSIALLGLRGAALAAAGRPPRRARARAARWRAGGGPAAVRADPHLDRRRHQRGGGGLDAGRPAACCSSTSRSIGTVRWRDAGRLPGAHRRCWACSPRCGGSCRWLVHARYGVDFLQFTEQPRSIWGTNSAPEALRLMAYWTSYIGVGFFGANRPLFSEAGTLLFNPLAVGASLLLPALAIGGFIWTRRWRYGAVLAARAAGRRGDRGGRRSRRARPAARRWSGSTATCRWCASCAPRRRRRRWSRSASAGPARPGAQLALARLRALPRGAAARGAGRRRRRPGVADRARRAAARARHGDREAAHLEAHPAPPGPTPARPRPRAAANSRALVLPGQIFANYTWGGTTDAILPRVTKPPGGGALRDPLLRPARHRPALDGRPASSQQRRLLPGPARCRCCA